MKNSTLILFLIISSLNAFSCQCGEKLNDSISVDSAFRYSDIVISGIVLSEVTEEGDIVYKIIVDRKYKGAEEGDIIHVSTTANGKACRLYLNKETTYLVYAIKDKDNTFRSSSCSRTRIFASSLYDTHILDRIKE